MPLTPGNLSVRTHAQTGGRCCRLFIGWERRPALSGMSEKEGVQHGNEKSEHRHHGNGKSVKRELAGAQILKQVER